MRLSALALALVLGACASDTGIIVEVSWDAASLPDTDKLRIYVGHDGAAYATLDDASIAVPTAGLESPYRYVVRPASDVASVGPLVFAAGLTIGSPPASVAFAMHPSAVAFADGELRTVHLTLTGDRGYLPGGVDGECAFYRDSQGQVGGIGLAGDGDCDGSPDGEDCGILTPNVTPVDRDGDGFTCNDCLDGAGPIDVVIGGSTMSVDPKTVFPGQTEDGFRAAAGIPDTVDCLHLDFDCSGTCGDELEGADDRDGSGAGACGTVRPTVGIACAAAPSDCDESIPGNTAVTGHPEYCDGTDANCDGRPASSVPCAAGPIGVDRCRVGARLCDDVLGEYDSCVDEGFSLPADVLTCALLNGIDACLYDEDPVDCAAEVRPNDCSVGISAVCPEGEVLTMPGDPSGTGCEWHVVGGTKRGDWEVGFLEAGATLSARTSRCGPDLHVRPRSPEPLPYTVIILGRSQISTLPLVRVLRFSEGGQPCDGVVECQFPILN